MESDVGPLRPTFCGLMSFSKGHTESLLHFSATSLIVLFVRVGKCHPFEPETTSHELRHATF